MGGRGASSKSKTTRAKRERKGLAYARNEISIMVANGNYSKSGAIKAVAKAMGTTEKQASRYVSKALSNPEPFKK